MSDDLVKRLRADCPRLRLKDCRTRRCFVENGWDGKARPLDTEAKCTEWQAADTIERLTRERDEAREALTRHCAHAIRADLVEGLEPYLDDIVYYASPQDEHKRNRLVHELRAALSHEGSQTDE